MKKTKILIIVLSITMLGISLFPFQQKSAKAAWCPENCYLDYTPWPGMCCNCMCVIVPYEGRTPCPPMQPE